MEEKQTWSVTRDFLLLPFWHQHAILSRLGVLDEDKNEDKNEALVAAFHRIAERKLYSEFAALVAEYSGEQKSSQAKEIEK